ncbi:MAG: hypothetical protein ACTHJ4_03750 [Candidatus Nucleicultricaceae bacterium]
MKNSNKFYYGFLMSILLLSTSFNSSTGLALSDQPASMSTNVKNLDEAQGVMARWKDEQSKTSELLKQYNNVIASYEKQRVSLGKLKTTLSSMATQPLEAQEKFIMMHEDLALKAEGKSTEEKLKAMMDNLDAKSHNVEEALQNYQAKIKDAEGNLDLVNKKIEKGQIVIDRMKNFKNRMNQFEPLDKTSPKTAVGSDKPEPSKSRVSQLIKKFEQ